MNKRIISGLAITAIALTLTGCAAATSEKPTVSAAPTIQEAQTINMGDTISVAILDTPTLWRATSTNPEVATVKNAYITEDGTQVVPSVQSVSPGTSTVKLQSLISGKTVQFDVTVK